MWLHAFLTSRQLSVQLNALDAITPGIGLDGPQSQSAFPEEEKNLYLCLEFNSISLVIQLIPYVLY